MANQKLETKGKNTPLHQIRIGRFQISTWAFRRLVTNGDPESTCYHENWVDELRVCIQHSTYSKSTGKWNNQKIWCSPGDLRNLSEALDTLNEGDLPLFSDYQETSDDRIPEKGFYSCKEKFQTIDPVRRTKLNKIIEYLKTNGFYHDLPDFEEKSMSEILSEYGIIEDFTDDEIVELKKDLCRMAEQNEFSEISRLTQIEYPELVF